MGAGRRMPVPLWALALALACAQHSGWAQEDSSKATHEISGLPPQRGHSGHPLLGVTVIPPLTTIPVLRALNPAHTGRVCSTWGDFHYKTFDGAVFRFPGLCNYVFSAHCGDAYEDFNVQLRRSPTSNATAPSRVIMKLNGLVVELTKDSVLVNGRLVHLPFSQAGVLIERSGGYVKVVAKLGLVFMWNLDDSLTLELDTKYANKTCGLCGDFNGVAEAGEFLSHNVRLTPLEFGNLQKMDGPTEQCQDPSPTPQNCSTSLGICEELLSSQPFVGCAALMDVSGYTEACQQDLCRCKRVHLPDCLCHTLAEFSRQCAHAGGQPQEWRSPDLCPQTCPSGMRHQECGSPCTDTCSNPQRSQLCEDHCVAGCFCPEGMVLDDIHHTGCVPVSQCACMYNGTPYMPEANYSTDCAECTCLRGRWSCRELPCPGTCSVLGGAHFSTFDQKQYTVHGDCSYVLTKPCHSSAFAVLAELRRCGLTDSETCLKSVTLSLGGGQTVVVVKAGGEVFVNQIYTHLPVSAANVTILKPSTFFIIAETNLGLQLHIQLVPIMQLFVRLAPELRGQTCGLCGNFNQNQADDFWTISGVVEGTGAAFANTWKTQASCPKAKTSFEDPCSLSVENEKYAQHWCSLLTDADGPFAQCHAAVSPGSYYSNCMFDTCNCEKSEDCLCAALSSYVQACATKGVLLRGWRDGVCTKPTTTCPKSMAYQEHLSTCQPTCRSLSEADVTCSVSFVPVDGCACPTGTFLDEAGTCVPAHECPCYHGGSVVPNGESVHDSGAVCTCTRGVLTCIGGSVPTPVCDTPMVYFDCHNATPGAAGAGCQKSCHTLDMACYSTQCVSGCVCPDGLVADGNGGCIAEEDCPCVHNEASYKSGETIWVGCNTCTCEKRMWRCTDEPCLATCAVYGDGHFLTFDGQRYSFSGACEYTLVQDQCSGNGSTRDTFRVVTENVPCGTTGTTCSKDIKIFLGSYELKLSSGKVEVVQMGAGQEPPYTVRQTGVYLVVDTDAGLMLLWDRKTSLFLRLSPEFKGRVCGLCGNFDDNAINDLTTRSQAVVGDVLEFGNSWKFSPTCPDALAPKDPCTANPYRKSWAQKQCSIINSATFAACRTHVEPAKYYEACVSDACACDSGGDCECFCTAVAAYAQACHEVGVCVSWRTPDVCPLFCDYYNPKGECEWHYQPCGAPCLRTCRNPSGSCQRNLRGLEGCYPKCPPRAPIFDEDKMQCVAECPPPTPMPPCRIHGKSYQLGETVPSEENCHSCVCTDNGVHCTYDTEACFCTYDGRRFLPGAEIYHTTDGMGGCLSASCGVNGTIKRRVYACGSHSTAPPTTFAFSTVPMAKSSTHPQGTRPHPAQSTAHSHPRSSTESPATHTPHGERTAVASTTPWPCGEECLWSPWLDVSHPGRGTDSGDFDTLENLRAHGHQLCQAPREVQCRAEDAPEVPLGVLGQRVECSPTVGLTCHNRDQVSGLCDNYQVRVLCCQPAPCSTLSGPTASSLTPVTTTGPATIPTASTDRATHLISSPKPVPTTSSCLQERCNWTQWIDGSYPESGRDGGDFDTFSNLRAHGYKFCDRPKSVECRAQFFPNTPLAELGQKVTCNNKVGLLCLNKDQLPPICYNYEIRIQCCEREDKCRETPSMPVTSATPQHTMSQYSTSSQGNQTPGTQPPWVSTGRTQTSTLAGTTDCLPQCSWTPWFDVDSPEPGSHGGDVETYKHILQEGHSICRRPGEVTELQCRARGYPEVPIASLGQVVQCDRDIGLVCRNADQQGPSGLCLDYEVRVRCCRVPDGCPTLGPVTTTTEEGTTSHTPASASTRRSSATSTAPPGTSSASTITTGRSSASTTTTGTSPASTSTTRTSSASTQKLSTTSGPRTSSTSRPHTSSTSLHSPTSTRTPHTRATSVSAPSPSRTSSASPTSAPRTADCLPQCSWTPWFDVDSPEPGSHGGDVETYKHILQEGHSICHRPGEVTELQCRARGYPEVPIASLGQVVQCDRDIGLVCRNADQQGPSGLCLDYEVRVRCCRVPDGCPTLGPVTTTTEEGTTSHTPASASTRRSSATSTAPPGTSSASTITTGRSSASTTTTGTSPASTSTTRTSSASTQKLSTTSGPRTSSTSRPHTSSTSLHSPTSTRTPHTRATSVSAPSPSRTSSASPTSAPRTADCLPQCSWTPWFDVDSPEPGSHGGDVETYKHILQEGHSICHRPGEVTELQCRARGYPEVPIASLGQVVQCDRDIGLVCRNADQQGPSGLCLDYEVRVRCCRVPDGCPTLGPVTTTTEEGTTSHTPASASTRRSSATSTAPPGTSSASTITTGRSSASTTTTGTSPASTSTTRTSSASTQKLSTTSGPRTSSTSRPHTSSTSLHSPTSTRTPHTRATSVSAPSPSRTSSASPTSAPRTSDCLPQCSWTPWFDVDSPEPGSHGGDVETYKHILQEGHSICRRPGEVTELQCRARGYPEVPIASLGQVVQCDRDIGLVCRNADQQGPSGLCLDYEVRVRCCRVPDGCPTLGPVTTTTEEGTTSHTPASASTRRSSATSTAPPGTSSASTITTGRSSASTTTTGTSPASTSTTRTSSASTQKLSTTSGPRTSSTSRPHTSSTSLHSPTSTRTPHTRATSVSAPSPSRTSSASPTSAPRTADCLPQCSWTPWFDVDSPEPGSHGGDVETYKHILQEGHSICRRPGEVTELQCRARGYPEVPIASLGQVVQCDRDIGLVCRNADQQGPSGLCLDYEVRVRCCRVPDGCPTLGPVTTTTEEGTTSHTPASASTRRSSATSTAPPGTSSASTITTGRSSASTTTTGTSPASTSTTRTSSASTQKLSTTSGPRTSSTSRPHTSSTSLHSPTSTRTPHTRATSVSAPSPSRTSSASPTSAPRTADCLPQCSWTPWFDVDSPEPGSHGGDVETYKHILQEGHSICHRPGEVTELQCRARGYPEVPIASLGQVVQCDRDIGLVCRNADQQGPSGLCLDYEVRVRCCRVPDGCPTLGPVTTTTEEGTTSHTPASASTRRSSATSTAPPGTSSASTITTGRSSASTTTTGTSPASTSTTRTSSASTQKLSTTSGPRTSSTSRPHTSSTSLHSPTSTRTPHTRATSVSAPSPSRTSSASPTSAPRTADCLPQCSWTPWFDVDSPEPGSHGGDVETYKHILQEGHSICHRPGEVTELQCRARGYPEVPIASLGQVVQCDRDIGLVCRNADQQGPSGLCLDYEVRVRCCRVPDGCPTLGPVTTTTEEGTTSHTPASASTRRSSATSTAPPGTSSASTITTGRSSASTTTTGTSPASTSTTRTSSASTQKLSTTSGPRTSSTSRPHTSSTSLHSPTSTRTPHTRATSVSAPSPSRTSSASPTSAPRTADCLPQCSWTPWFDVDSPEPGSHGGDVETYKHILQEGHSICHRPGEVTELQCRARGYPEVPIASLGQVVQCDRDIGLVCRNADQQGPSGLCLDYEVRVRCCRVPDGCPTLGPVTTTTEEGTTSHTPASASTRRSSATSTAPPGTSSASTITTGRSSASTTTTGTSPASTSTTRTSSASTQKLSTTSGPRTSSTSRPHTSSTSLHSPTSTRTPHTRATSVSAPSPSRTSSASPTSAPRTADCLPQCSWTPWFDVDSPEPGSHGGDVETYKHILQEGHSICHRPQDVTRVQCRSQRHPEVPIASLGQVVQCDRDIGLVCRNADQQGPSGLCLDYEVRVLCCHVPDGCRSSTMSATVPFPTETSSLTPLASSPSSPVSSSSLVTSPRKCFCHVSGQLYPAGSVIYHQTDLDGHCYHAVCSWDCHVTRGVDPTCPSLQPTPTPTLPASTATSMHISNSSCLNVVPPRKKGETWAMPNCSQATCEGDNVVSLSPRLCPELTPPFCANGYPALKVADADSCCQHYQCQCVCSGWGDPHYITFDGTYYTFLDDCTYVLVQQIVPVFGHFRVLVDNDFCDVESRVSCPQSIIVEYHEDWVVLTRRLVGGVMTNQILFNGEVVSPGFQKNGIAVSRVGIKMYVTIQELHVQVMFSGLIFSVEVPFSMFANNTEGQCGTCTNNTKDECRMPGGELATSCSAMAKHWKVDTPDQPFCHGPPPTPTSAVPDTPPTSCPPPPICKLILSEVFELCHTVIEPLPFFEGCVFDYCHKTELEVVCSSLELYASLCAAQGVCVDWRGRTNNSCPFPCPSDKVYQPCGPSDPPYCYRGDNASSPALPKAGRITEGCFCPDSLKLFSTSALVCVPEDCPSCPGLHGEPIQPGQVISEDCQECVCDPVTKSMTCHQKACPPQPACHTPGFVSVPTIPKAGQCCPQYSCVCNSSYCPKPLPCPEGSHPILTHEEGACCSTQNCNWTKCSVNGTLYQPGAVVSSSLCETCRCDVPSGPDSDGFMVSCETQICNTHCPVGFEYQPRKGQCCGECVQKFCVVIMNITGHPARLLKPGESWSNPGSPCVYHTCERYEDRLEVVTVKRECPPLSCPRAEAQLSQDGCCLFCPPMPTIQPQEWPCTLRHREQVVRHQNCSSATPVRLAYCEGICGDSTSKYSLEADAVEHRCHCCQELRTSRKTVMLRCEDGSSWAFGYTQVEECGCQGLQCQAPMSWDAESGESREQGPRPPQ